MNRGKYIVLEGMDCSGKTALSDRLSLRLRNIGRSPYVTPFPSNGPVGEMIRNTLAGRVLIERKAMLYLFTADGVDRRRLIEARLESGFDVISDRHPVLPGWVYQRQEHPLCLIEAVHHTAPLMKHDGLFVIDVPAVTALNRQRRRVKYKDVVYENDIQDPEALAKAEMTRELYFQLAERYHARVLDGLRPTDELVDQIFKQMRLS